jgi:hypothetical protein
MTKPSSETDIDQLLEYLSRQWLPPAVNDAYHRLLAWRAREPNVLPDPSEWR